MSSENETLHSSISSTVAATANMKEPLLSVKIEEPDAAAEMEKLLATTSSDAAAIKKEKLLPSTSSDAVIERSSAVKIEEPDAAAEMEKLLATTSSDAAAIKREKLLPSTSSDAAIERYAAAEIEEVVSSIPSIPSSAYARALGREFLIFYRIC